MIKRESGITLIALVVTIVVLLILAGVSINLVLGNNGIISKAKDAKVQTRAGTVADEVEIWKADVYLANNTNGTKEAESAMLARLRTNNLITDDDEVDTANKVIKIKKSDGTVVREIPYSNVKINISMSRMPRTEDELYVSLKVTSVEGLEPFTIKTEDEFNELRSKIGAMDENIIKELMKNAYTKFFNDQSGNNFINFTELFEYYKENETNFTFQTEDDFYNNLVNVVSTGNIVEDILYFYGNENMTEFTMYGIINPDGDWSGSYVATEAGEYTFTIKDLLNNGTYSKTVVIDSTTEITETINIFKYTQNGYITGIRESFLTQESPYTAQLKENIKLAALNKDNGIKVAATETPELYLISGLKGCVTVPEEIGGTKIVGIAEKAFYGIRNLEKVTINADITKIDNLAFSYCDNLTNIIIPKRVVYIGLNAFAYCNISEITIPESVLTMRQYVFVGNPGIKVNVPFEEGKQPSTWDDGWDMVASYPETRATIAYKQPAN